MVVSASDIRDCDRLRTALAEIAIQNPAVGVKNLSQDGFFTLEGRAKADLQLICDRLRDVYGLAVDVGLLDVVLLETVRKRAEGEGKYIRQTGGKGNYGHCKLRIEPSGPDEGYAFISGLESGAIPIEYIDAIEHGVLSAMEQGVLAGFPVVDVRITLHDGSYHEADSNEMAFKLAGAMAFKEAAKKASPVLLEPMMALETDMPEELAATFQDRVRLNRGRVGDIRTANGFSQIRAIVPLAELLASSSVELSELPMEFAGYEPVSNHGPSDEDESGVTANKPNGPKPARRSEIARPEQDDD